MSGNSTRPESNSTTLLGAELPPRSREALWLRQRLSEAALHEGDDPVRRARLLRLMERANERFERRERRHREEKEAQLSPRQFTTLIMV